MKKINFKDGFIEINENKNNFYLGEAANKILCNLIKTKKELSIINNKIKLVERTYC